MKLLITGGTGFIGRPLCRLLVGSGHQIIALTRRPEAQTPMAGVEWIPVHDDRWQPAIAEVDGLVHLAGESVVARRWSPAYRQRIVDSRVQMTRRLVDAMAAAHRATGRRPAVMISASAIGYYGNRGDEELTERSQPGQGFLAECCQAWEAEAVRAEAMGVQVVRLRIGMVLGPDGGALAKMIPPFRWGAGGPLGHGRQWVSWIHRDDLLHMIAWALNTGTVSGPVNATAPDPVQMRAFAAALGRALHRPSWAPVPAPILRILLGDMAQELLLASQRVLPVAAQQLQFSFRYPDLDQALAACVPPR